MKRRATAHRSDDVIRRAYESYYAGQVGGSLPVFYGARMQRGHGLGSIFSGLFRSVLPLIKRFAPALGRKALQTGVQIARDVALEGQPFKQATKTRVLDAVQEGINKLSGEQSGSGKRRRATIQNKKKKKPTKRRRRNKDVFD